MAFELPQDRALTEDELEDAMIHALLNPGGFQPGLQSPLGMLDMLGIRDGSAKNVIVRANGGSEELEMRFLAVLWRWVGAGLLVNRGPTFLLAPGARELFEARADEADIVLHRSGLARRLRERCPNLDAVTERYAGFAQESFLVGHYQAAAVMIGVASEAALLHFVSRCQAVLGKLGLRPRRLESEQAVKLLDWIAETIRQYRRDLVRSVEDVGGENWIDDLPGLLGIATGIRLTRNEAGHPTPHTVSRDECRGMLGLFPRLAEALFVSAAAFDAIVARP
jgi:hypothetical protein